MVAVVTLTRTLNPSMRRSTTIQRPWVSGRLRQLVLAYWYESTKPFDLHISEYLPGEGEGFDDRHKKPALGCQLVMSQIGYSGTRVEAMLRDTGRGRTPLSPRAPAKGQSVLDGGQPPSATIWSNTFQLSKVWTPRRGSQALLLDAVAFLECGGVDCAQHFVDVRIPAPVLLPAAQAFSTPRFSLV